MSFHWQMISWNFLVFPQNIIPKISLILPFMIHIFMHHWPLIDFQPTLCFPDILFTRFQWLFIFLFFLIFFYQCFAVFYFQDFADFPFSPWAVFPDFLFLCSGDWMETTCSPAWPSCQEQKHTHILFIMEYLLIIFSN